MEKREAEKAPEVKKGGNKGEEGSSQRKRNVCGGSVGGERERAGTAREKKQKFGCWTCVAVCVSVFAQTQTHVERQQI